MKRIVMFSGGIGSWMAAKRVAEMHGTESMILLFADTHMEDWDLYRFIEHAARNVGAPLVKIADGRTPWEVFRDERFLGNSRVDPCSKILKRKLLDRWRDEHCNPETDIIYLGIDWTEAHRLRRLQSRVKSWRYEAPLIERPLLAKWQMLAKCKEEGIKPPRLYELGFPHNNCGGFCVKAGIAHFVHLLKTMPKRYRYHENKEEELRRQLGKDVSILRRQRDGETEPLTLRQLREEYEAQQAADQQCLLDFEAEEWGGCGCAIE